MPVNSNNQLKLTTEETSEIHLMSHGSIQTLAASILVKELLRLGVRNFVLSPGARAIPIVLAINHLKYKTDLGTNLNLYLVNDERSAAFMAQGASKSGSLSCLICTSGTAVANYLPGVVEAYYSKVPLIVISTDRPWELHYAGSNQTIHQKNIFSDFTSFQLDLPAVEKDLHVHSLLSNIDQAVYHSIESNLPVHLNVSYRKPFYDADFIFERDLSIEDLNILADWWVEKDPYFKFEKTKISKIELNKNQSEKYLKFKKPIIISGPFLNNDKFLRVKENLKDKNIPIFADIHSNLRQDRNLKVSSLYNSYISEIKDQEMIPDVVFLVGDRLISDSLHRFLNNSNIHIVRVSDSSFREDGIENEFIYPKERINYETFFEVMSILNTNNIEFSNYYFDLENSYREKTENILIKETSTERSAIFKVLKEVESNTSVFLSNSLIFREAENFSFDISAEIKLFANRGATGIDGIISSSIGTVLSNKEKLVCILGDQAALHDLTSLSLINLCKSSVMILIINNCGGSIFNLMKKAELRDTLINPHSLNFKNFAEGFNLNYFSTNDSNDLVEIQKNIFKSQMQAVVEFNTDGIESVKKLYNL
jgi:2-succinyl-5-enolpyruvyl-6-hydroxy-3-cyclohexene-1-carboxylate synthase